MISRLLAVFFALALMACSSFRPAHDPDHAFARASFVHMGVAALASAKQCTSHAQWLAGGGEAFDFDAAARATLLADACTARLIPIRDAIAFSSDDLDPWTPKSAAKFGCVGKTVRVGLEAMRADFTVHGVKVPEIMGDGIRVGAWAEQWAEPSCDPLHPTTTVVVTIDKRVVPLEPDYPPQPTP